MGVRVLPPPGAARRAAAAGHQVGVHSFAHRNLTALSPAGTAASLRATQNTITAATGVLATVERTLDWLEARGYTMVTVDELLHPAPGSTYGARA